MEKLSIRKPKTTQMKYPASSSYSWSSPEPVRNADKPKKKSKKNSVSLEQNLFPGCCRRSKPKPLHGSDPYAPHLKYGIFPQQSQKAKSPPVSANTNRSVRAAIAPDTQPELNTINAEHKTRKKGQLLDTPLFVIRPIDKHNRRHLSAAETLHLDIKPQSTLRHSPIRKHSSTFKNVIQNISESIEYT